MDKIHIDSLQTTYDYIILGAGIAGLQAADIFAQRPELKTLILEAQSWVGGRIGSVPVARLEEANKVEWVNQNSEQIKAALVEKGATWIEQRHLVIKQLCKRFGITLRERYFQGSTTFLNKDQPLNQEELIKNVELVETIKRVVEAFDKASDEYNKVVYSDLSLSSPQAQQMLKKYDNMTLLEFLNQQIPESLPFVHDIFDTFLEHSECMSAAENSMHEVLTKNAKSNDIGVLKEFLGAFESEPCYVVNGGTDLLISGFLGSIEQKSKRPISDTLKLKHQVITVDNRPKDHITILCQTEGGLRKYRCKQAICSVPLAVSRSISFENISKAKRLIIDNQLRTSCRKSFIVTKKPFWRRDANGEHYASGDGLLSREYPVNVTVDVSPPDQSCGTMLFFHCGKRLTAWESTFFEQDYEKKKNYLIDLMCKMFKVKPEDKQSIFEGCFYSECSYMTNPYIRSGFQSLTRPGIFSEVLEMGDSLEALYRDENGIIFIGSEYSLQFGTFMEGAVRVAREKVYQLLGEKDPWAHLLVENVLMH